MTKSPYGPNRFNRAATGQPAPAISVSTDWKPADYMKFAKANRHNKHDPRLAEKMEEGAKKFPNDIVLMCKAGEAFAILASHGTDIQSAEKAEYYLKAALEIDPDDKFTIIAMMRFYGDQGRFTEAEECAADLFDLKGDELDHMDLTDLGKLYSKMDKPDWARACFQEALRLKPDDIITQDHLRRFGGPAGPTKTLYAREIKPHLKAIVEAIFESEQNRPESPGFGFPGPAAP